MSAKIKNRLSTSLEDYLESIYDLAQKDGVVRVKGISRVLNVSMPSAYQALHVLMKSGLVKHENYGSVEDACRVEHNISQETLDRLVAFIANVDTYRRSGGPDWLKSFKHFSKTDKRPKECRVLNKE